MSGVEVCIIIIPNDFPNENDDDQAINGSNKHSTSQSTISINEKAKLKDSEEKKYDAISTLDVSMDEKSDENNHSIVKRRSIGSSVSLGQHTKEYPCPECNESLASRFRHHTIRKLKLRDTVWIPTNNKKSFLILCYTDLGTQADGILEELRRAEIGIRDGTKVFFLPISCALGVRKLVEKQKTLHSINQRPATDEETEDEEENNVPLDTPLSITNHSIHRFKKSIRARINVHKLIGLIRQQSLLTFDYLFFCVLASVIACLGLLENSTVIIVASMLISPLMGPIMGFVIGVRIHNKKLCYSGFKSECTGLLVSVLTGFLFGLCTTWSETSWGSSESFPTDEMRIRGDYRRLWFGALVALPSGAAAALSFLSGNFGSLVGVAISASLLPPAVNTGLLFSYSLLATSLVNVARHSIQQVNQTTPFKAVPRLTHCSPLINNEYLPLYSCDMPEEAGYLAMYSFIITLTNILCISLMAVIVLYIKEVLPIISDTEIDRLWHSNLDEIRNVSNNNLHNDVRGENLQELVNILEAINDKNNGISQKDIEHFV
ncbi:hypothetical protein I4U23_022965 [Adineta vaga]|nr:hypothetical protein I4U23_022965 [Adineta vaga]